ncbi:MAG TPA: alpha/beta hydrolase [Saprospiraceae bacterium]|jgi:pimeloyl-ACP methyl ester carboxylesterase|nr:alpha/beta hydrolase [Saprospiraceae bacterium]
MDKYIIKEEGNYKYIETGGEGTPLVLLHGLLGALSNFEGIINHFSKTHNVVVPILPLFEISLRSLSVMRLVDYVDDFVHYKNYTKVHILGNSLGGHIAQLYALKNPDTTSSMTLTGSSGLFESAMGNTFPKRGNYEYMKKKAESVFYDPAVATKELVDDIYVTVNDLKKAMCVIAIAKSAVRHNLEDRLDDIKCPTLLIWGIQDSVTPIWVGEKFHELIPNSELVKVDHCGHAPMMERPELFNIALESFMTRVENNTFMTDKKDTYTLD